LALGALFPRARAARNIPAMPLWLEYLLFALYVILGPCTWGFMILAMFEGRRRMTLLLPEGATVGREEKPVRWIEPAPRVTVIVPAKDEAGRIEACIRAILAQDYPDLRVVAADDRSSDGTGEILDRVAKEDARLTVVHLVEADLEAGWLGKSHALRWGFERGVATRTDLRGVEPATRPSDGIQKCLPHQTKQAEYLLFHDSDLRITDPQTLRQCVMAAQRSEAAILSALPALESGSFIEGLILPLGGMISSAYNAVALTNVDGFKSIAYANGQFMMTRRDVYEAIGGHAAVKGRYCEDVAMARIVKTERGGRLRVAWGAGHATVRMYDSLGAVVRGLSRIFADTRGRRPWPMLAGIGFLLCCAMSLYLAIGWTAHRFAHPTTAYGHWGWLIACIFHFGTMTVQLAITYAWSRNRWWYALLLPLAGAVLIVIYIRALVLAARGTFMWRGTRFRLGG